MKCVFKSNSTEVEKSLSQYINNELVQCLIIGEFFIDKQSILVDVFLREYDSSNSSIIYESNKVKLAYQS